MATMTGCSFLCGLLMCLRFADSRVGEHHQYTVKHRREAQTMSLTIDQLDALRPLSFSKDSEPVALEPFSLSIFETNGILPRSPSLATIQAGFEEYLMGQLNTNLNVNHQVQSVHSRVLGQTPAASSTGGVDVMSGTQLLMAVDIIFEYDPSPHVDEVESTVDSILRQNDLSPLVNNITSRASGDIFLEDVHTAVYDGKLPEFVNADDFGGSVGIITTAAPQEATYFSAPFLVPVFIAFALLLLGVLLFILPRRTKEEEEDYDEPMRNSAAPVSMFGSEEGNIDLYIEDSLSPDDMDGYSSIEPETNSPRSHLSQKSTLSSTWNKKQPGDEESDVFSGIAGVPSAFGKSGELSPKGGGDSRSIYSFLTGLTSRGSKASTVMASNVTAPTSPKTATPYQPVISPKSPTPHSRMSSLFTFSEEEDTEEVETDESMAKDDDERQIKGAPSDEEKTLTSDEQDDSGETMEQQNDPTSNPTSPSALSFTALAAGAIALVNRTVNSPMEKEKSNEEQPSSGNRALVPPLSESDVENAQNADQATPDEVTRELQVAQQQRERVNTEESFTKPRLDCAILGAKPMIDQRQKANQPNRPVSPQLIVTAANQSSISDSPQPLGIQELQTTRASSTGRAVQATTSPTQSIATHHTDPGQQSSASDSPAKKSFIKRFFSPSKRATMAATTTAAALASWDELADAEDRRGRRQTGSAGVADGTSKYQNDNADHGSTVSSYKGSLSFRRGNGKPLTVGDKMEFEAKLPDEAEEDWISPSGRIRRHTKSTKADGTNNYQNEFMHDYSIADLCDDEPTILNDSQQENSKKRRLKIAAGVAKSTPGATSAQQNSPHSQATPRSRSSSVSGLSGGTPRASESQEMASKNLISDLLWLEKKITTSDRPRSPPERTLQHGDSLSFESGDGAVSTQSDSSTDREGERTSPEMASGIVCRDCIAPPGKLKIVICSTKDGPAIHTVKKGSSLEGQVYSGDLIISVDNVDTRSFSAEQVMKLMTAKTQQPRRITVLHFDDEDEVP